MDDFCCDCGNDPFTHCFTCDKPLCQDCAVPDPDNAAHVCRGCAADAGMIQGKDERHE
jgi:hypothetical protein